MDPDCNGGESDLFSHGYGRLGNATSGSFTLAGLAYDSNSSSILMVTMHHTKAALAVGPLCKTGTIQRHLWTKLEISDPENPYLLDTDCESHCGIGPFVVHDSKVYFLSSLVWGRYAGLLTRVVHLRILEGCHETLSSLDPGQGLPFLVLDCSRIIATIHSHPYAKPIPDIFVWTSAGLVAIGDKDGDTNFVIQLFNTSSGSSSLTLIHVNPQGNVQHLYNRSIDNLYTSGLPQPGMGSIDYRDGILCWSAADILLCSILDLGPSATASLSKPLTLVEPGEAVPDICTGERN